MTTDVPPSLVELADRLYEARAERGLSLRAAAAEIGVSASTLYRAEMAEPVSYVLARRLLAWVAP